MARADFRFAEIYGSYFRQIHAYCRRRTSQDRADDTAAEVFLIARRRIDNIPQGEEALLWLYGVAQGVVSNVWRGVARQKDLQRRLDSLGITPEMPPEDVIVRRQDTAKIMAALTRLRSTYQEVLRLAYWEELSHAEIATLLDISVESVRQRLSRARRSLAGHYNRLDARSASFPFAQKGGVS